MDLKEYEELIDFTFDRFIKAFEDLILQNNRDIVKIVSVFARELCIEVKDVGVFTIHEDKGA